MLLISGAYFCQSAVTRISHDGNIGYSVTKYCPMYPSEATCEHNNLQENWYAQVSPKITTPSIMNK